MWENMNISTLFWWKSKFIRCFPQNYISWILICSSLLLTQLCPISSQAINIFKDWTKECSGIQTSDKLLIAQQQTWLNGWFHTKGFTIPRTLTLGKGFLLFYPTESDSLSTGFHEIPTLYKPKTLPLNQCIPRKKTT